MVSMPVFRKEECTMPLISNFSAHEADMESVPKEENDQKCPICGEIPEWLYVDEWGDVVGCSECLSVKYLDDM